MDGLRDLGAHRGERPAVRGHEGVIAVPGGGLSGHRSARFERAPSGAADRPHGIDPRALAHRGIESLDVQEHPVVGIATCVLGIGHHLLRAEQLREIVGIFYGLLRDTGPFTIKYKKSVIKT